MSVKHYILYIRTSFGHGLLNCPFCCFTGLLLHTVSYARGEPQTNPKINVTMSMRLACMFVCGNYAILQG